jgi:hypothetical protein
MNLFSIVIIFIVIFIIKLFYYKNFYLKTQGGGYVKSPHIVIDTLNLTHYLNEGKKIGPELIIETINATSDIIKKHYKGNIIYVLKDRDSKFNDIDIRNKYQQTAIINKIYISIAEKYINPPSGVPVSYEHSSAGRDDFYMSLLAYKYRCQVLTGDSLKDFNRFRATLQPFYVYEYSYWSDFPKKEYIRPESTAYTKLKKPYRIHPSIYF